jgi:hypothetical protein
MWFGQPRRNYANCLASHRVSNKQQSAFSHAKGRETLLTLVLPIVAPIEGKRIVEYFARSLKRDAMPGVIRRRLLVVPLERAIVH